MDLDKNQEVSHNINLYKYYKIIYIYIITQDVKVNVKSFLWT